jgi:hypothetical protein
VIASNVFTLSHTGCPSIDLTLKDITSGTAQPVDSTVFTISGNNIIMNTIDHTKINTYILKL